MFCVNLFLCTSLSCSCTRFEKRDVRENDELGDWDETRSTGGHSQYYDPYGQQTQHYVYGGGGGGGEGIKQGYASNTLTSSHNGGNVGHVDYDPYNRTASANQHQVDSQTHHRY